MVNHLRGQHCNASHKAVRLRPNLLTKCRHSCDQLRDGSVVESSNRESILSGECWFACHLRMLRPLPFSLLETARLGTAEFGR